MKSIMFAAKLLTSILAIFSYSTSAYAQDQRPSPNDDRGAYLALGATLYGDTSVGPEVKLGYNLNKFISVEAQAGVGITDDSRPVGAFENAATLTSKVDYSVGAFAVGRVPLNKQFDAFFRVGIHSTQYNFKLNNALASDFNEKDTGFAGGGGLQYNLDKKNAIRAEYTYLDGSEIGTASLSYVRKF